jgi:hypothetical protein
LWCNWTFFDFAWTEKDTGTSVGCLFFGKFLDNFSKFFVILIFNRWFLLLIGVVEIFHELSAHSFQFGLWLIESYELLPY